jgi:glycerol-3-phosphate acyltransferase PlsX
MSSVFKTLRKRMSADAVGGSPLIGVNGLSIIAHGSATGIAILNAIRMACEMHGNNINEQIVKYMGDINEALKDIQAE